MFTIFKKQETAIDDSDLFLQAEEDSLEVSAEVFQKAKAGAAGPLYDIADAYYNRNNPEDYKKSLIWYQKAGEKGYPAAVNDCGYLFMEGLGVDIDYKLAMEYFLKAAELNLGMGFYNVGYMYRHGLGVDVNYEMAVEWLRKGSDQGCTYAHNLLAAMYRNGYGVEIDHKMALNLYKKGRDAGSAESVYQLGYMYENGLGVSKDKQTALACYNTSAEMNYAAAKEAAAKLNKEGYYLTEKVPDETLDSEAGWQEKERQRSERVKLLQKFLEQDEEENRDLVRRVIVLEHDKRQMAEKLTEVQDENTLINEKLKKLEETVSKLSSMLDEMKANDTSTVNNTEEKSLGDNNEKELNNDDESDFCTINNP